MHRIEAIDFHRFVLIVIMALAHSIGFFAGVSYIEFWYTQNYTPSFSIIRVVSHLAAPGFFLVLGIGVSLLCKTYRKRGEKFSRIRLILIQRGVFLVFLQFCVVNLVWFLESHQEEGVVGYYRGLLGMQEHVYYFGVLWALGISMILAALTLKLRVRSLICLGVSVFIVSTGYTQLIQKEYIEPLLILSPVLFPYHSNSILVFYSALPWFSFTALGIIIGRSIVVSQRKTSKLLTKTGILFIVMGTLLRIIHVGNAPFNDYADIATFLTLTKYSPSLVFMLLTIGINMILLSTLLVVVPKFEALKKVSILGKYALQFYVGHLIVLLGISYFVPLTLHSVQFALFVWVVISFILFPFFIFFNRKIY
jgi:uncharacterized membrane protein